MSNRNFTIHSGERTSTLTGEAIKATSETIALAFDVTTVAGAAATLDISVEWSPNGTNFGAAASPDVLPQITAAGVYQKRFDVKAKFYRVVYTIGGDIAEIQAVEHDHTGGTFTLSFDGEGPTGLLDWDAPVVSVAAVGLLTMDVKPSPVTAAVGLLTMDVKPSDAISATGTLTIQEPVTDLDTITIDTQVYRLMDTPSQAFDIEIGVDEAETKVNIILAINATGAEGVNYFAGTTEHPTVSAATFVVDDALFTADTPGTAGDAIAFAETFNDAGNTMNGGGTLGGNTAGTAADTLTIDAQVYTFQNVLTDVSGNVLIGASLATAQANLKAAVNREAGYGTVYAELTDLHPTVSMGAFAASAAQVTAKTPGTAGDAIATTETFLAGTNIFDETTLGGVTAGIAADTLTIGSTVYTFVDVDASVQDEVFIGATLVTAQDELVVVTASNPAAIVVGFAADVSDVTAVVAGTGGNAIASTETFVAGTNVFDASTLGTDTLGVNGVQTELELFTNIATVGVVRNGNGDWDVTFPSEDGDVALMTIDGGNLTGGASATVTESTGGVDATATFFGVATHFDANK